MTRKLVPRLRLLSAPALFATLASAGCASSSGPIAIPPDAAAIHAAGRARGAFEERRRLVRDPDLGARIAEIGVEALAETPLFATPDGVGPALQEGWRFAVLDDPEPEAFLFANRTVFVSRGALAALPGEAALVALFRSAATTFASGAFRPVAAGELVEQPLSLVLPAEPDSATPAEGVRSRDRWLDLLDGLLFGQPAEYGVADGRKLLLPGADVHLSLPGQGAFEPAGRGVFRATRKGEWLGLTVRELPASDPSGNGASGRNGNGVAAQRAELADLGARLRRAAACRGAETKFTEAFRVRGFTGVRTRLDPAPRETGTEGPVAMEGACEDAPRLPEGSAAGAADAPAGLIALVRSRGSLIEVSLHCGRRRFDACEALFVEVLESADRLWDAPAPESLRIAAVVAGESGSVRGALGRLAAGGRLDAPLATVEFLNRGWIEEPLGPGERVLILSRNPGRTAPAAGGKKP
ncbi:MAG: hypothetical protein OXE58_15400 [Acidobacteria bacterium]|nr:hypothetical protein [Acidobacteriota bacterium]